MLEITLKAFYANVGFNGILACLSSVRIQTAKPEAEKTDLGASIFDAFMERGNLDFLEQIWVRMRKSECYVCYIFKYIN